MDLGKKRGLTSSELWMGPIAAGITGFALFEGEPDGMAKAIAFVGLCALLSVYVWGRSKVKAAKAARGEDA